MERLSRINAFMGRNYPRFVLGGVALGLLFADSLSALSGISIPLFAFITFANSLGGGFRALFQVVRHPLPLFTVFILLHVVMPLIAMGVGNLLFPQAPLFTMGLILEYSIPTAVASLMWIGLSGGNLPLGLSILMLDTVLAPFIIPLTLRVLVGSVVKIDALDMMGNLLIMVAIPALLAMALHDGSHGRVAKTVKPVLDPFAKVALLTVIVSNSTGCAPFLRNLNGTLLLVMLSVFLLCLFGYVLGFYVGLAQKQPFPTAIVMALNTGMRNNSVGAVLAIQYFPPEVLFPAAFTPLFLQASAAFISRRLMASKAGKAWQAQQEAEKQP